MSDTAVGQVGHRHHDSRPICDYCGGWIDETYQRCPALDDGRCRP